MHGADKNCIQGSGTRNLKGSEHLRELGVDGKIILRGILRK
jgi:hypothetical protein